MEIGVTSCFQDDDVVSQTVLNWMLTGHVLGLGRRIELEKIGCEVRMYTEQSLGSF